MEFPTDRSRLWDRTPFDEDDGTGSGSGCPSPIVVASSADVVPPVYLSPAAIRLFLEQLATAGAAAEGTTEASFDRKVSVEALMGLRQLDRDFFDNAHGAVKSMIAHHPCILRVDDTGDDGDYVGASAPRDTGAGAGAGVGSTLTIPVSTRPDADTDLLFPAGTTFKLLLNLGKAIRAGRETSLRSSMRIRAAGCARLHPGGRLHGTARFEVVLPDVSFRFNRIRAVPVLSTALSIKLARRGGTSPNKGNSGPCPTMGYVTLNASGKAVPVLETDAAVGTSPLVGVWTAHDDDHTASGSGSGSGSGGRRAATAASGGEGSDERAVRHPLTWAACLRYLHNEHIKERVHADGADAFLLVRLSSAAWGVASVCVTPPRPAPPRPDPTRPDPPRPPRDAA